MSQISVRILKHNCEWLWLSKNKSNEGVIAYQATPFFAETILPQKAIFKKLFSARKQCICLRYEFEFTSKLSAVNLNPRKSTDPDLKSSYS